MEVMEANRQFPCNFSCTDNVIGIISSVPSEFCVGSSNFFPTLYTLKRNREVADEWFLL